MPISHRHTPFQYSEYISPLPADDIIKLGLIKQDSYNKGVEQIQQKVDALDEIGLNLIKDEDRTYFAQEMEKLTKAINESAAKTDFSNINNVRNILSIGRPLENDENILNALQSSKEAQRRFEVLKSLKPEERSPANDDYYLEDYHNYLNDGKVGSKLASGKAYIPYRDLSKKYMDIVGKLKPNITSVPQLTANGWIITTTTEGLDAAKLQEAFEANLNAADKQQLFLDARYDLKQYGKEAVAANYQDYARQALAETTQSMARNQAWVDGMEQILAKTPDPATQQKVTETKQLINELSLNQKLFQDILTRSPEEFDEQELVGFHKQKFITNLANSYAYSQIKQEMKENPYYMEQIKYSNRVALENLNNLHATKRQNAAFENQLMLKQLEDKGLLDIAGEFGGLYNVLPGYEKATKNPEDLAKFSYFGLISGADGKKYLTSDNNNEIVGKWEKAQTAYKNASTTFEKVKALKELVNFSYNPDKYLKPLYENSKMTSEQVDIIGNKEKSRLKEVVNNLYKSYETFAQYSSTGKNKGQNAVVHLIMPNGTRQQITVDSFLGASLSSLVNLNPKIELYVGDKYKASMSLPFLASQWKFKSEAKPYVEPEEGFQSAFQEYGVTPYE